MATADDVLKAELAYKHQQQKEKLEAEVRYQSTYTSGAALGLADAQSNSVPTLTALETVRESWLQRRSLLLEQLHDIDELLDLIGSTPNLERIVELSNKFPTNP